LAFGHLTAYGWGDVPTPLMKISKPRCGAMRDGLNEQQKTQNEGDGA